MAKSAGKNPFIWMGPIPRVNLTDPELIREVVNNSGDFRKAILNPLSKSLAAGLVSYEGEQWAKHRKIINPAFYQEKLKVITAILSNFSLQSRASCKDVLIIIQTII